MLNWQRLMFTAALTRDDTPLRRNHYRMKEPPWLLNNLNDSVLEKQTKVSSDALGTLMMAPERMTSLQDCCDASLRLSSDLAGRAAQGMTCGAEYSMNSACTPVTPPTTGDLWLVCA